MVDTIRTWLWHHEAVWQWGPRPLMATSPQDVGTKPDTATTVIGGWETTRERVVYQRGRPIQVTMAMEDVMAILRWSVAVHVCG